MKKEHLCYGTDKTYREIPFNYILNYQKNYKMGRLLNYTQAFAGIRPSLIKRIKMTCPICKRRVWSSIQMSDDADLYIHTIPPHKPKMWWKKSKRKKYKNTY
jgi:hypothetical protein